METGTFPDSLNALCVSILADTDVLINRDGSPNDETVQNRIFSFKSMFDEAEEKKRRSKNRSKKERKMNASERIIIDPIIEDFRNFGQKATDNPEDTRESIKNRSSSADLPSSSMKISPVVPNKKYRRVIIQEDDSSDENIEF